MSEISPPPVNPFFSREFGLVPVQNIYDVMQLRKMRNAVRGYMTHNTGKIGRLQQLRWFIYQYMPRNAAGEMVAFVYWRDFRPIGYGLIREQDNKFWVSGGLIAKARGQGYGKHLFTYLTRYVRAILKQPFVYLDVRNDNARARELYGEIGYQELESEEGITVMRYPEVKDVR